METDVVQTLCIVIAALVLVIKAGLDQLKAKKSNGDPEHITRLFNYIKDCFEKVMHRFDDCDKELSTIRKTGTDLRDWHKPVTDTKTGQPVFRWYNEKTQDQLTRIEKKLDQILEEK